MNKKLSIIILSLSTILLYGCFTVMIRPIIYEPSVLRKVSANVSYCVDDKLKNIELVDDKGFKVESNFGKALYYSLQKSMEQIFYSPKEVNNFDETQTEYFILLEKDTSDLKAIYVGSLFHCDYEYTLKIRLTIYKNKKKVDEVIIRGYGYQGYKGLTENLTSIECIKYASQKALDDVIKNLGEYLMNYKF